MAFWNKKDKAEEAASINEEILVETELEESIDSPEESEEFETESTETEVESQETAAEVDVDATPVVSAEETPAEESAEVESTDFLSEASVDSTSDETEGEVSPADAVEDGSDSTEPTDSTEEGTDEVEEPLTPEQLKAQIDERRESEERARFIEEAKLEIEAEERFRTELADHLADLNIVDARLLPELDVPDWREELEFVKERYEPCDLSDHIVKVSKRRLIARQIDYELAQSRLNAYTRYLERASRRFKEKIDEDNVVSAATVDLHQWRSDQAKSVAWRLADRVNEEVLKAKQAEIDATSFVQDNTEYTNPEAVAIYRHFARRVFLIPLVTAYIASVVGLTYGQFEWIMKFFPFFNLGIDKTMIMIAGIGSYFWVSNLWKYSKKVAKAQKKVEVFTVQYEEQYERIRHAVKQHTRLAQQQPLVEPILKVLAKGYRVQLQSDVSVKAQVTTDFNPDLLPACVTLARAVDTDEMKMARLKRRALSVLMSPGWRTLGLDEIARIHADSRMLDSHALSLKSLDTDSVVSAANAQKLLLDAFTNTSIHERVSKARLVRAIRDLHFEVLANWNSDDRPRVESLRDDGFDKLSFRSSWLLDVDVSEDWIQFLTSILNEETAPFGIFNILDKKSELNDPTRISSLAVVPHYFQIGETRVKTEKSPTKDVTPMDVVVRVDVSPWADPSAFAIFADGLAEPPLQFEEEIQTTGGTTSA